MDADRTSLFLVDNKTDELYARIFDIGTGLETKLQQEIRSNEIFCIHVLILFFTFQYAQLLIHISQVLVYAHPYYLGYYR